MGILSSSTENLELGDGYRILNSFVRKQFLFALAVDGNKADQAYSTERVKMHNRSQ